MPTVLILKQKQALFRNIDDVPVDAGFPDNQGRRLSGMSVNGSPFRETKDAVLARNSHAGEAATHSTAPPPVHSSLERAIADSSKIGPGLINGRCGSRRDVPIQSEADDDGALTVCLADYLQQNAAQLGPSHSKSFGHLREIPGNPRARSARTTATPTARLSPETWAGSSKRHNTER